MGVVYRGTASLLPAPATRFLSGIFPRTTYSPGHRLQMMATARSALDYGRIDTKRAELGWIGMSSPAIVPTQRGPHLGSDQHGMRESGDGWDPKEEQSS